MSVLVGNQCVRRALVPAMLVLAGCATTTATQALVFESSPVVQHCEEIRAQLAERDKAAGGSIQKGGCPVCTW